jgi:hypothetical protein
MLDQLLMTVSAPVSLPPVSIDVDFDRFIANNAVPIFDDSDITSMFVGRDGSGGNPSPGETVGLQLDKSSMGGMTAAAYIDSRPNLLVSTENLANLTHWSRGGNIGVSASSEVGPNGGAAFELTGNEADSNLFQEVDANVGELFIAQVQMKILGNADTLDLKVRRSSNSAAFASETITLTSEWQAVEVFGIVPSGETSIQFCIGGGNSFSTGESVLVSEPKIKHIPGQHRRAAADNERPVLDRRPVGGRRNLLTYTEDFSSAAWSSNVATTVTENTDAAPDGTLSGDTVEATTTSQQFGRNASVTASSEYTFSLYVKHKNSRWLRVYLDNQSVWFDVENGLVGTNQLTGDADIVDIGGGWVRLTATHTAPDATMSVLFFLAAGDGSTAEVSGAQFGFWGAQLELGSTATPYQRVTNDNDITETGVRSVYSLEYDGADDGMSFDFEGGAGPADCSVFCVPDRSDTNNGGFFSSTTGSGFIGAMDGSTITDHHNLSGTIATFVDGTQLADERRNTLKVAVGNNQKKLVEFRNCNLSNWPGVMVADIFSAPYEYGGNLIGPIIVETSKPTNSLRRSIETYLKRKAGIL